MSKIVRRPKRKTDRSKAQLAKLVADVEALKTGHNEMSARLGKLEVVREPSPTATEPEKPQEPYRGEPDPNVPPPG